MEFSNEYTCMQMGYIRISWYIRYFKKSGTSFWCPWFFCNKKSDDEIKIFSKQLECKITSKYDAVFSVNYFSYIAEVCYRLNIQYICYNVDSPLLNMQHPSINYKTNHIYTFDSKEAKDFNNNGVDTVYSCRFAQILNVCRRF